MTASASWADTFESDSIGSAPSGWAAAYGANSSWSIESVGSHVLVHGGWAGSLRVGASTWSNYSVSVSIKPSGWGSEYDGLSFAATESGRYTLYLAGGNQLVLGKWVNNTWTKLAAASYTFDPSHWYTISVNLPGGSISAYVNGTLVLQATDSSFSAGEIGLDSNDPVSFDNIVVALIGSQSQPPSSPPPPSPPPSPPASEPSASEPSPGPSPQP